MTEKEYTDQLLDIFVWSGNYESPKEIKQISKMNNNRKSTFANWKIIIQAIIGASFFALIFLGETVRKLTGSESWVNASVVAGFAGLALVIWSSIQYYRKKTGPTK